MSSSEQTHDHTNGRGCGIVPVIIANTSKGNGGGILRIHFHKYSDKSSDLQKTNWDTYLKNFDEHKLDFLYK